MADCPTTICAAFVCSSNVSGGTSDCAGTSVLTLDVPAERGTRVGVGYRGALAVQRGRPPYIYRLVSGRLPPGLYLNPVKGTVSGVATQPGAYDATFLVIDSAGGEAQATATFTVAPLPPRRRIEEVS